MEEKTNIIKDDESFKKEEWYNSIIEEGEAVIVERKFALNFERLRSKWLMGQILNQFKNNLDYEVIEFLNKKLDEPQGDLFACIQFYEKYPEGEDFVSFEETIYPNLPEGKNLTWPKIKKEYLGIEKVETEKDITIKRSYKVNEILQVLKSFLFKEIGLTNEKEINDTVELFREEVIKKLNK